MTQAEILAVGDELCYGRVYDTNSFWLANQITRLGVIVHRITCVRDDSDEIHAVLKEILSRKPKFIFITGGLGPTEDDRTLEGLSKLTGRTIIVNQKILNIVAKKRRQHESQLMPWQLKMASTIEGAECLPNPEGWAPLTIIRLERTVIFIMPGPPREVQSCFTTYLIKEIQDVIHYRSFAKRIIVNMFESEVAPLINQILKTVPGVYLKSLVGAYVPNIGLPVEIIVFDSDEESCQRKYLEILSMFEELVNQKGKKILES
jgi:molybdenum cofactor synthesis domain-containing protein